VLQVIFKLTAVDISVLVLVNAQSISFVVFKLAKAGGSSLQVYLQASTDHLVVFKVTMLNFTGLRQLSCSFSV